jgi:quercetin dioxygenase-like cupin family protein
MQLRGIPFEAIDWSTVPASEHPGVIGVALWRTRQFGEVRVRMVEYSPGYVANHWCEKGHIVLCLEGEIHTELEDAELSRLLAGKRIRVRAISWSLAGSVWYSRLR